MCATARLRRHGCQQASEPTRKNFCRADVADDDGLLFRDGSLLEASSADLDCLSSNGMKL
jgi:hypothetical protein